MNLVRNYPTVLVMILWVLQSAAFTQAQDDEKREYWSPANYLKKLDQNQNGMLEPDELSDQSRGLVEKLGFDTSSSISIDRVVQKVEEDHKTLEEKNESRSRRRSNRYPVPPFGESSDLQPIPDFSLELSSPPPVPDFSLSSPESNKEKADNDWDESDSRPADSSNRSRSWSSSKDNTSSTQPKRDINEIANKYVEDLFKNNDLNQDGQLDSEEQEKLKYKVKDINKDGIITRDEALIFAGGGSAKKSPDSDETSSQRGSSSRDRRGSGSSAESEPSTLRRDFRGLRQRIILSDRSSTADGEETYRSDEFTRLDKNEDDQIQMAEFSDPDAWTLEKIEAFYEMDQNHDGLITPEEWRD